MATKKRIRNQLHNLRSTLEQINLYADDIDQAIDDANAEQRFSMGVDLARAIDSTQEAEEAIEVWGTGTDEDDDEED